MYTSYANYVIWFTDQAEYNAAVALAGGNGWGHCPFNAATTFGITWPLVGGGPITGTKGIYGSLPYGIPGPGGFEVSHPAPSGVFLLSEVDSVDVPGQVGNPPQAGGQTMHLVWWGNIVYSPTEVAGAPPTVSIPQRRWISGFEATSNFDTGAYVAAATQAASRCSSRTGEGSGYALRGNNAIQYQDRYTDQFRAGLTPKTSWERFYIRVNALGTNELIIWRAYAWNPTTQCIDIRINTSGTVLIYNGTAGSQLLIHTSSFTFTLGKWYLFDVLLKFANDAADTGRFRLYINHTSVVDVTNNSGTGIDNTTYHRHSVIGQQSAAEDNWSVDLDDWICADVPNIGGVENLNSLDWLYGSHVKAVQLASGTVGVGWTGAIENTDNFINPRNVLQGGIASSTALSTIEIITEETDEYKLPGAVIGPVAAWAGGNCWLNGGGGGRVGISVAGGAYTYVQHGSWGIDWIWVGSAHFPSGLTVPISIVPLKYIIEHPNTAFTLTFYGGYVAVEYIGVWGREDDSTFPLDLSNNLEFHNCRYLNTQWGLPPEASGAPDGPVFAVGGTYIGNDTGQTINLPAPAHFIFVRGISGSGAVYGSWSFAGGYSTNRGTETYQPPNYQCRLWTDSTGQTKFTVAGTAVENNALGVTYQYIAFCDPGMRFNCCGVYNFNNVLTSGNVSLFDPNFLAQCGFVQIQYLNNVGSTSGLSYKGPGHAGITGEFLGGLIQTDWGSFSPGNFSIASDNIIVQRNQNNFSLWKTTDYYGYTAVQIFSYTGDGNAVRVINFPIITGRWPLFALVLPHVGAGTDAYFRDPSHTANNSCRVGNVGNNQTNGITSGGADLITVGSGLNSNGVIYDVFIILGDDDGWNNGIFGPPSGSSVGTWTPPPYVPSDLPIIIGDGGMNFNGDIPLLLVQNMSGIYTLVPGKTDDTIYTGFGDDTVDVKKPDPTFKTGYIGG